MKDRNKACPCGSGKKRKRCCGDSVIVPIVMREEDERFIDDLAYFSQKMMAGLMLDSAKMDSVMSSSAYYAASTSPTVNSNTTASCCTMESLAATIRKLNDILPPAPVKPPLCGPSIFEKTLPTMFAHEQLQSSLHARFRYEMWPVLYTVGWPIISVDGPPSPKTRWGIVKMQARWKLQHVRFLWQNRFRDYRRPREPMGFWF